LGGSETPSKSGYDFANSETATTAIKYCATAAPTSAGTTGINYYAVSVDGVIYKNGSAYTCAAGDLTVAGSPIQ
jgi:hypothetical protein